MRQCKQTAQDHVDAIRANVADFYADSIAYEEFGRRARALWDAVPEDLHREVSRHLGRKPAGRSPWDGAEVR